MKYETVTVLIRLCGELIPVVAIYLSILITQIFYYRRKRKARIDKFMRMLHKEGYNV